MSRTTLANWMIRSGHLVQALINLIRDGMLEYGFIQMDETTVQVLHEPGKATSSKSFMWVQRGGPPTARAIFSITISSRGGQVPKDFLAEYQGWLQTDGYWAVWHRCHARRRSGSG
ncbi:MAG: transposase [Magnetococcales bacterium]|nr:transposase [Magnetococcales bacterium]